MPQILGLKRLQSKLKKMGLESKAKDNCVVVVGYTQTYAVYVHENTKANHPVGQAKFLSGPADTMADEIATLVEKAVQAGVGVVSGLTLAGLRLQRESQKLVPVDTGALKNSAFTSLEKNVAKASLDAFERSETIRKKAKGK